MPTKESPRKKQLRTLLVKKLGYVPTAIERIVNVVWPVLEKKESKPRTIVLKPEPDIAPLKVSSEMILSGNAQILERLTNLEQHVSYIPPSDNTERLNRIEHLIVDLSQMVKRTLDAPREVVHLVGVANDLSKMDPFASRTPGDCVFCRGNVNFGGHMKYCPWVRARALVED